jgi:hypothetical protein
MQKTIHITHQVVLTYDKAKFTKEFMANFQAHFYPFTTVDQHLNHIAYSIVRGTVAHSSDFLEGYGKLSSWGITWDLVTLEPGE